MRLPLPSFRGALSVTGFVIWFALAVGVIRQGHVEAASTQGMLQVLLQTFSIMGKSIKAYELQEAEIVVKPALDGVGSTAFAERQRSIQAGRRAMQQALPELRRYLQP